MEIDEYLIFAAGRVKEARLKLDYKEVKRLLRVCAETMEQKIIEIDENLNKQ